MQNHIVRSGTILVLLALAVMFLIGWLSVRSFVAHHDPTGASTGGLQTSATWLGGASVGFFALAVIDALFWLVARRRR